MERSIRRSELASPTSTPPSSPDLEALDRLKQLDTFEYLDTRRADEQNEQNEDAEDVDGELTFRLFAPTKSTADSTQSHTVQKINLRSPTPENKEPGFVQPNRDRSYYIADYSRPGISGASLSATAISGEQVKQLSCLPWPGVAYPWKVLHLPAASGPSRSDKSRAARSFPKLLADEASPKRRRKGKKARIKVRVKLAARQVRAKEDEAAKEAKEVAFREKKARRNREKQIKRRSREKAAKLAKADDGVELASDGNES